MKEERWYLTADLLFAQLLLEKRPNLLKPQFLIVKDLLDMQYAMHASLHCWYVHITCISEALKNWYF